MNKKYLLLSLLTGILLAFSYPNFIEKGINPHTFFFIWFGYIPLVYILFVEQARKRLFLYAMLSGCVLYLVDLYWVCNIKPMGIGAYIAWGVLGVYMSLFMAAAFLLARVLNDRFKLDYLLSLPAAYTVMEFCREWVFTGFQLLTPAQSQQQFPGFLQLLKITGVYGPAFLILFVNVLLLRIFLEKRLDLKNISNIAAVAVAVMLVLSAIAANFYPPGTEKIKAAVLQPDIDQDVEWSQAFKADTMKTFDEMIKALKNEKPGMIVWPETGYPGILNLEPSRGIEVAGWMPGAYNLVGSDSYENGRDGTNYYNSAFLLDEKGVITGSYAKYHLVPFGEYVPLQHTFNFVKKVVRRYGYTGFTPGKKIEPLEYRGVKFGVVICYDSLFPEISREFAQKGARFLAHLSYETWYGKTPCTAQIFQNTALRAVENNIPMIRCVASGMSGFVDSKGMIYGDTALYEKKTSIGEILVQKDGKKTFYTRFGDWFPYFLAFLLAALAVITNVKRNDSPHN